MATSGTYAFNPSLGEIVLYAYGLCQVRNTAMAQEHMETARMATNMMLSRWSNQGVNLWAVDQITVPLVQGTATYSVPANTVMMLDAYITTGTANTPSEVDRIILPVSRTEYASYPSKQQQGFPTVYWFDRLLSPTVTLWPVPSGNEVSLVYYRVRQIQDSAFTAGQTVEVPYLWLEAFALGLAQRLAMTYRPEMVAVLKPSADEAYQIAADQNVENANTYISPQIAGYFR